MSTCIIKNTSGSNHGSRNGCGVELIILSRYMYLLQQNLGFSLVLDQVYICFIFFPGCIGLSSYNKQFSGNSGHILVTKIPPRCNIPVFFKIAQRQDQNENISKSFPSQTNWTHCHWPKFQAIETEFEIVNAHETAISQAAATLY